MNRTEFHKIFKSPGPVVLPVVHVVDNAQAERNVAIAIEQGAAGVFLINHDFAYTQFLPIIRHVRARFPSVFLGVNFLAVTGLHAFGELGKLQAEGVQVDAYWADDACIDEHARPDAQTQAQAIAQARVASQWQGLYLGGTCFKKQREVNPADYAQSAKLATEWMDVVCTSGVATGHAADAGKISTFRRAMGDAPLALASGITPENAAQYAADVDCFLVATGINAPGDFYNIDPARLHTLLTLTRKLGAFSP